VRDVVPSLLAQGIHRVVLLSGHGGNFVLEAVVQEWNLSHPDLTVVTPSQAAALGETRILEATGSEIHAGQEDFLHILDSALEDLQAGEVETFRLMALHPHLAMTPAADATPLLSREYLDYLPFASISAEGLWGRPTLDSADRGVRALSTAVKRTCEYIQETFAVLENLKGCTPASAERR
jgi:creatinine amidohydrolase